MLSQKKVFLLCLMNFSLLGAGEFQVIKDHIQKIGLAEKKIVEFGYRGGKLAYELAKENPSSMVTLVHASDEKIPNLLEQEQSLQNLVVTKWPESTDHDVVINIGELNRVLSEHENTHMKSYSTLLKKNGELFLGAAPEQYRDNDFKNFQSLLKSDNKLGICFMIADFYERCPSQMLKLLKDANLQFVAMNIYEGSYTVESQDLKDLIEQWFQELPHHMPLEKEEREQLINRIEEKILELKQKNCSNNSKTVVSYAFPMLFARAKKG